MDEPLYLAIRALIAGQPQTAAELITSGDGRLFQRLQLEEVPIALDAVRALLESSETKGAAQLLGQVVRALETMDMPASTRLELTDCEIEVELAQDHPDWAQVSLKSALTWLSEKYGDDAPELIAPLERLITLVERFGPAADLVAHRAHLQHLRDLQANRETEATGPPATPRSFRAGRSEVPLKLLDIFYVTHRSRTHSPDLLRFYSGRRGELEFGSAQVAVRVDPQIAQLASKRIFRLEFRQKAADFACLRQITPSQGANAFYKQIHAALDRTRRREVFLFIHGFNVSFRGGLERAAKMSVDLDVEGATVLYSWPSQASLLSYFVDRNNRLHQYIEDLASAIAAIAQEMRPASLLLVAHSMGNEFLLGALQLLHQRFGKTLSISDVVFASPDVDRQDFISRVSPLVSMAGRMTLYASKKDRALQISQLLQSYERAGHADKPAIVPGIDTIDTTFASGGLLGHADFSGAALDDLRALAWTHLTPEKRPMLAPVGETEARIWRMLSASLNELAVESDAFGKALTLARYLDTAAPAFAQSTLLSADPDNQILLAKGRRLVECLNAIMPEFRLLG
jgi:esterase/lipase superfamily enzyme